CQIRLDSDKKLPESFFQASNYELRIVRKEVEINIQVIYGKFDDNNAGYVALNTFSLKNQSQLPVDPNLLIIRENYLYNYKNILNLSKKIIENHL
ncbi:MAG: hypothetical protein E7L04_04185, partial [Anaerococcus sp.]|nr:hypothetical protein [Anaerococcus sp.]